MGRIKFAVPSDAYALRAALAQRLTCWAARVGHPSLWLAGPPDPLGAGARHYETYMWTETDTLGMLLCCDGDICEYATEPLVLYTGGPDMCPLEAHATDGIIWVTRAEPVPDGYDCVGPPLPPPPPPTDMVITNVAPATAAPLEHTTIYGDHLTGPPMPWAEAIAGGQRYRLQPIQGDNQHAEVELPANIPAGQYRIGIEYEPDAFVWWAGVFTVKPPPPLPTISSVVPNCTVGWSSGVATMNGTNLLAASKVFVGAEADGVEVAITGRTATKLNLNWGEIEHNGPGEWTTTITVVTPAGRASYPFRVTAPGTPC